MEKRPMKCPLCGSTIKKVMNATTKNFYYKCSNRSCNFVLSPTYTEEEYQLQGQTLETSCIKCGKKLTVVNGPNGLYARCFNCDCDEKPFSLDGRIYRKWVNANRRIVQKEVENLVNCFKLSKDTKDDAIYDFEAFIAIPSDEKSSTLSLIEEDTIPMKVIKVLQENMKRPMGALEISKTTGCMLSSIRTSMLSLRSLGFIKIVDYNPNPTGNHTLLYQVTESPLPELKIYTKEDGYSTIASFLKDNTQYGSIVRAKERLMKGLREAGVKPILFHSSNGICSGYPITVMNEIMKSQPIQTKLNFEEAESTIKRVYTDRTNEEQDILKILRKNMKVPYTTAQLTEKLGINHDHSKAIIRDLRKRRKVKIVGWNYIKGQRGATALKYQLTESPLPRLKTTTNNNLYITFMQFYRKKLHRKDIISMDKAKEMVQDLPIIPLIINQRAYIGYAVSDLKETFKDYFIARESKRVVKTSVDMNIETGDALSYVTKVKHQKSASNFLMKRNSLLSSITSLFKKKEKIRS